MSHLIALDEKTGKEIKDGDTVYDFRGDAAVFKAATRERAGGKSGKVCVQWESNGVTREFEYYDSVFDIVVVSSAGLDAMRGIIALKAAREKK